MVIAFVGLGSNKPSIWGEPAQTVWWAMNELDRLPDTQVLARSSLYETMPQISNPDQIRERDWTLGESYINAVVKLRTEKEALALLRELHILESRAGRERSYPDAPRTLDLDLLLYGDVHIQTPQLQVPHPRMRERAFVMEPLREIAAGCLDGFVFD
jgi:2-amino-4-hydroxy-6-hydroxymethyldihydropteridine diphosphokinase